MCSQPYIDCELGFTPYHPRSSNQRIGSVLPQVAVWDRCVCPGRSVLAALLRSSRAALPASLPRPRLTPSWSSRQRPANAAFSQCPLDDASDFNRSSLTMGLEDFTASLLILHFLRLCMPARVGEWACVCDAKKARDQVRPENIFTGVCFQGLWGGRDTFCAFTPCCFPDCGISVAKRHCQITCCKYNPVNTCNLRPNQKPKIT